MRVLVTGSSGLLGSKLLAAMATRPNLVSLAASRQAPAEPASQYFPLDITDPAAVERVLIAARPDVVIHTAAMTDVDGCEREAARAWAVNVDGTAHVVAACNRVGARLVHLSTEYVFDGTAGPYTETDPPNPLSVYGRSKLASEEAVAVCRQPWAVARTTVLFGYAPSTRRHFVLWLLDRLAAGEPVRIVADQIGSPTLADNLAEMVLTLATAGAQGVYHTVGTTRLGRHAFAQRVASHFGFDPALVQPITTAELRQPAPRPLRAGLLVDRFCRDYPQVTPLAVDAALDRLRAQLVAAGEVAPPSAAPQAR
jgi:dTDP-4-dehydrorhamnose reductase